ncbi:Ethylene-responsive transcription factor 6 [Cardamine amara subsp. amara]|uniref:Ethylene-responsive transcription factor 6 n=1 Tax=Cardamine amara subsp. amara TaxID=228776 RepID=A0ABD1A1B7_CARAN
MATPSEVSALFLIKNHLLDEFSPMPTATTNRWMNESLTSESSFDFPIFGSYGFTSFDQTGFEFSEFETKPEIIDHVTPKFTNESEFSDFELKPIIDSEFQSEQTAVEDRAAEHN